MQLEGLITQLVFEHALRIRMKEEKSAVATKATNSEESAPISEAASETTATPGAATEDTVDTLPAAGALENPVAAAVESEAATTAVSNAQSQAEEGKEKDASANLIGKINNLVSSDLQNIVDLPELPMVLIYVPLKAAISIWFLYTLLGWRFVLVPVHSSQQRAWMGH